MKVLMQEWNMPDRGILTSISKNQDQLDVTIREIESADKNYELVGEEPLEVEIPDDHDFVGMLDNGTIFLTR